MDSKKYDTNVCNFNHLGTMLLTVKTPTDHIVHFFPMTGRTSKTSAYKWRNTAPSKVLAFLALLYFTSKPGTPERAFAVYMITHTRLEQPLVFMSTMAAMFGVQWKSTRDPKAISLLDLDYPDQPAGEVRCPLDAFSYDIVIAFIKTMIGQISVTAMTDLIKASPSQWTAAQKRISCVPGSLRLASDLNHLLAGNKHAVSWASAASDIVDSHKIIGVSARTLNGLRRGDGVVISAVARQIPLTELMAKAKHIAAKCTNEKRLYEVKWHDDKSVMIKRRR